MEYRQGKPEDLKEITKLISAAVTAMEEQGIYQWDELYPTAEDFSGDISKNTLYVAEEGGKMAAVYVISGECDEAYDKADWALPKDGAYILHRFCVFPAFQNKGLGKICLKHIENQIRNMGYDSLRLDVFSENPIALRLYRNSGYAVRGYADWRKGRFELMEKDLRQPEFAEKA